MTLDPQEQLELFQQAVFALGGQAAANRYLGFNERHMRRLWSGNSPLHDGILEDVAKALIEHADKCRALERRISPAFAANLTADQLADREHPDGRGRLDRRRASEGSIPNG